MSGHHARLTEEARHSGGGESDRGQTNLDFIVGVSIFIIAIVFVWLFLPNLFGTFTVATSHGESLAADRAINSLTGDAMTGQPGSVGLDEDCVAAFFGAGTSSEGCGFNPSDSLTERVGLRSGHSINVSAEFANGSTLYWKESEGGYFTASAGDQQLVVGPQAGDSDVSVARRIVSIDGQRAVIVVRVW